ncbi:hypothetical protein GCM10017556_18340 [Micromonospora sagamiensis]|uniref:O-methyltransferase n=1 Tax=Micromonospora sagamiensis TaxID=47875 RepID=A0A562WBL2_9ACTN|nr:hypothetical protein JD81_00496 [Micromonospora sagamiensis]BCL14095.1 hypothetical protein GCM10017556_18340 [Micromonospora sagamiensis]
MVSGQSTRRHGLSGSRLFWEAMYSTSAFTGRALGGAYDFGARHRLLNDERTGPPAAALMGMTMLVETEGGRNYSGAEYAAWLTDAGFTGVRTIAFDAPGANGAVVARRP